MTAADAAGLTDAEYWDRYWSQLQLPAEVRRAADSPYLNAILDVFDAHVPSGANVRTLEVGGAPGQYLAYLHRTDGHRVACLDYSPLGC